MSPGIRGLKAVTLTHSQLAETSLSLSLTLPHGTIACQTPELSHMLNLFCVKESLAGGDDCSLYASCVSSRQHYLLFCNKKHARNFRTILLLLTK